MQKLLLTLACLILPLAPARAQDFSVFGGTEFTYDRERDGAGTGSVTALNSYIEVEKAGFYAGVFGEVSNLRIENEVDLYLGYRAETAGGLSYDLSYYRYYYPNDGGNCCGEVILSLGAPLGEKVAATLDLAYDPQTALGNAYIELEFFATDAITLSTNYGVFEVEGAGPEREWDVGATYALSDETALDLRYYDGTDYPSSYVGLSLTWDTTIFSR